MSEQASRKRIQSALNATLSGLNGDPQLARRVLQGTRTDKRPIRRTRLLLIAALALTLLCGTAFALLHYYSVRDFQADGKPSASFEQHIVEVGQTFENDYVTLTVGDAIFDGHTLAVTIELYGKDKAKPVYLYPQISGSCGGRALDLDVTGQRGDFQSGFLYPNVLTGDVLEHRYGFELDVYEDTVDSAVTWNLSFLVMTADWPVIDASVAYPNASEEPFADYMQHFRDAYQNRQILVTCGEGLWEYVAANGDEASQALSYGEEIAALDAFTLVDTLECSFTTELPPATSAAPQSFSLDDRTVTVDVLNASVMSLSYRITQSFDEPTAADAPTYNAFALYDQAERTLVSRWTSCEWDESERTLTVAGEAALGENAVTAVTFKPCRTSVDAQGGTLCDDAHSFTVKLCP